jgi:hypothetical protein
VDIRQPSVWQEEASDMPDTLRLTDSSYMRRLDVQNIIQFLYNMQCVELIGFSNIGKSALMRLLAQPDVWTQELGEAGREFLPVYIDCNRMLQMSDHGFYELVLRCLQETNDLLAGLPELTTAYETMVAPSSDFQVPLSFNRGLTAALQASKQKLVLLFDEFDEPFANIDSRVFINLRAFSDRYGGKLAYVTATEQSLASRRPEDHCAEFCELFSHHMWRLAPLTHSDVERFVRRYMTAFDIHFTEADIDFIYEWAGGHPRLLNGVCRVLEEALEIAGPGMDATARWQLHEQVARTLRNDEELLLECDKIWNKLNGSEHIGLLCLQRGEEPPDPAVAGALVRQHLLLRIEGKYQPFCRLFAEYLLRKQPIEQPDVVSLGEDVERGEAQVNGQPIETLTNLEFRLLSLLFQNRDKIIDKYTIVTSVWGEGYIDEVDDARIEKLVSRLRQKIETDPSAPKFLTTIRGRGYKLVIE